MEYIGTAGKRGSWEMTRKEFGIVMRTTISGEHRLWAESIAAAQELRVELEPWLGPGLGSECIVGVVVATRATVGPAAAAGEVERRTSVAVEQAELTVVAVAPVAGDTIEMAVAAVTLPLRAEGTPVLVDVPRSLSQ